MADNYLEKKFEEYSIRKSTAKTKKIVSTGPKPEHIEVRFPTRRVFVTGGANGIGKAIVQAFRKIGCRVAFCDNDRKNGSLTAQTSGARFYPVDVCNSKALQSCMHDIFTTWGDIDILINNAGFGISGAVEFTETSDVQRLFDVNFFGMVRMNRAILPLMREQGHGRIVNLSSVAAPVPIPFQTYYSAGKAAVNSYTMALSNEVKPFGITVAAVMPGDIKTGFTAARQKNIIGDDIYGGRISRSVAGMEKDEQTGMDPAAAGRFIADVALKNSRKPLYTIGLAYKGAVFLTKILPARWLNGLIGMIYAK